MPRDGIMSVVGLADDAKPRAIKAHLYEQQGPEPPWAIVLAGGVTYALAQLSTAPVRISAFAALCGG